MNSGIFKLDWQDISKGIVMAVLAGFALPVAAAFQTPGFDIFSANWGQILTLAENGAAIGFVTYLIKNFFSDSSGKVLGSIG